MKTIDFGFLFAKALKTYGLSVQELLDLNLRKFWFLVNQIDRITAEEQIAQVHILGAQGSNEAVTAALKSLQEQVGKIYVWEGEVPAVVRLEDLDGKDPGFDQKGLQAMKQRLASQRSR